MPPLLQFHAFAATRGDGLRPELRILFERLAEVQSRKCGAASAARMDTLAGPGVVTHDEYEDPYGENGMD
jgi:hypothetical protein